MRPGTSLSQIAKVVSAVQALSPAHERFLQVGRIEMTYPGVSSLNSSRTPETAPGVHTSPIMMHLARSILSRKSGAGP